jgi:small subunit ribosomal protein S21
MPNLVIVKVRDNNLTQALKVFKKKVSKSGHLEELKSRTEYLKPSVVKRLQKNKAVRKQQIKQEQEREWY